MVKNQRELCRFSYLDNAIFQPSKIKSVHGKNAKIYRENIRNFPKFLGVSNLANDICVFCSGIVIFYYKNQIIKNYFIQC